MQLVQLIQQAAAIEETNSVILVAEIASFGTCMLPHYMIQKDLPSHTTQCAVLA